MTDICASNECPSCGEINFFCLGDSSNIKGIDTDALTCWNCKHKWLLEGAEEWGIALEDAYIEEGSKKEME